MRKKLKEFLNRRRIKHLEQFPRKNKSSLHSPDNKLFFATLDGVDREKYVIVHYKITPKDGLSLEQAALRIACEVSLRSLHPSPLEDKGFLTNYGAKVLTVKPTGHVLIGYPINLFGDDEGIAQIVLVAFGGVEYDYSLEYFVEQIDLPLCIINRFQGPRFGIDGIRDLIQVYDRPIFGLSVKPRAGISLKRISDQCYAALLGGADYIADDLFLSDPPGEMSLKKRIPFLVDTVRRATRHTGEKKWYIANISASPLKALQNAQFAFSEGVDAIRINAFTMGFPTLNDMASYDAFNLPIITTNMGVGILTRTTSAFPTGSKGTGVTEAVISKLSRLAGADGVHLGTIDAGCFAQESWNPAILTLHSPLNNVKRPFIVTEGNIDVANLCDNILTFGSDVMLETCHGIIAYPGGAFNGAKAFRLLVQTIAPDMTSQEAHKTIIHLAQKEDILLDGLEYFGYSPSDNPA